MAEENEDLEILVPDDENPDGEIKVVKAEEEKRPPKDEAKPEPKVVTADEGIDTLKQRLAAAESGRQDADRRAGDALRQAAEAKAEVQDSNLALVTNAIETVKANQATLRSKLKDARDAGDIEAEAEVLEAIGANGARLEQLTQGKVALENAPKVEAKPVLPDDPVEAMAIQIERAGSQRSAAWIRAHPECARSPRLRQQMLWAHEDAVNGGHPIDSDGYFEFIETTLGMRSQHREEPDPTSGAATAVKRRESPPPAAPPGGGGNGNGVNRQNVVRLTAQEREMASMMQMTDQEYAKNKLALQKEGKLH